LSQAFLGSNANAILCNYGSAEDEHRLVHDHDCPADCAFRNSFTNISDAHEHLAVLQSRS